MKNWIPVLIENLLIYFKMKALSISSYIFCLQF